MNITYDNNSKNKTLGTSGGLQVSISGFEPALAFPFLSFRASGMRSQAQARHITNLR